MESFLIERRWRVQRKEVREMGWQESGAVLVTGGARGIGRAVVEQLAASATRVIVADLNPPADIRVDVRREDSVTALFEQIEGSGVRVQALVHCAGIGIFKPIAELSTDDWNSVVSTNLTGAFLCSRATIRHMLSRGGGRIVHIGSVADHTPLPSNGAYGCAKAGVRMLTQIINEEYKAQGIRATLLSLGAVYTDIWKSRPEFSPSDMLSVDDVARVIAGILSQPAHVRIDETVLLPPKGLL
jgi:NAD(P)-dependent dehydrogenase (short-subunit alcohol dehydrogenase family)